MLNKQIEQKKQDSYFLLSNADLYMDKIKNKQVSEDIMILSESSMKKQDSKRTS